MVAVPETPAASTARSCITDCDEATLSLSTAIYDLFSAFCKPAWLIVILAPE